MAKEGTPVADSQPDRGRMDAALWTTAGLLSESFKNNQNTYSVVHFIMDNFTFNFFEVR